MKKLIFNSLIFLFVFQVNAFSQYHHPNNSSDLVLEPIGTFEAGIFDEGAAEISAYDPESTRLFVTNAGQKTLDILDISDPTDPVLYEKVQLPGGPNSVDVHDGLVAVAVEADPKQNPGSIVFYDVEGHYINDVTVGALPDMVTFTNNGKYLIVANEGEPNDDYSIDPEGSVSIINMKNWKVKTASFNKYDGKEDHLRMKGIRIFGPNASASQDFEPEYIAISKDSKTAWVVLQENNAFAKIDIKSACVTELLPLGYKDHTKRRNALDASNRDGEINISTWPVKGMYMPDAIASYRCFGKDLILTANEGDSRDYSGFSEEKRVMDLSLDPTAFPNAAELQLEENLGRLKITKTLGDTDGDGDYDELYSYGARSFSIWSGDGRLIYDSGKEFEKIIARELPNDFNSTNDENDSFDDRSDDKGPEAEGITVGKIDGRSYAFIGMERVGGIMVYDISNPFRPNFVSYVNNRDFNGDPAQGTAGDLGPEGLLFIPEYESPIDAPLLVVTNEVSGTTTIYEINTGEEDDDSLDEFIVKTFPNPVTDKLMINFSKDINGPVNVEMTNMITGKSMLKRHKNLSEDQNSIELDVSYLPKNIYVMKLTYGSDMKVVNIVKN